MFALGIVVYEALTGVHPFHKNQFFIGQMNPLPIKDFVPVDDRFSRAVEWMLEVNPVRRPSTCQQILQLIEGVV